MQKKYSDSVRIFYPLYNNEVIIKKINRRLRFLESKLSILLVALFGSYATGHYTTASDIDVLVIYKGKQKKDAYQIVKKTLGIHGLELHIYTEYQARRMSTTIQKMIKNGIVLYQSEAGLEDISSGRFPAGG